MDLLVGNAKTVGVVPALSPSFEILRLLLSELQDFIDQASDNEVAWDEVRRFCEKWLTRKKKTVPLTDEELATQLSLLSGLDVSTHSVLKYREKIDIPNAVERRD